MLRPRLLTALIPGAALAVAVVLISQSSSDGRRTPVHKQSKACSAMAKRLAHVAPARGVPRVRGVFVGMSANLRGTRGADRCQVAYLMQAVHVHWLREDIDWKALQPARGAVRWGAYDAVVRLAAQRRITLLPVIDDTPSWAGSNPLGLPNDPADYASFVAQVAARYGPGGQFWHAHPALAAVHAPAVLELYNEPYLNGVDPGAFAQLVRQTAIAVQATNPRVSLLVPTVAGAWLEGMYAAVPDLFRTYATAGAAVHPYSVTAPSTNGIDTSSPTALVHAAMVAHGDPTAGVWITEIGWSTCPVRASGCVSERSQATDLAGTLKLARTIWQPWLKAVFVYQFREFAPRDRASRESWFGLTRPNGSPKPAWRVLLAATRP